VEHELAALGHVNELGPEPALDLVGRDVLIQNAALRSSANIHAAASVAALLPSVIRLVLIVRDGHEGVLRKHSFL
jgi:hypothetical protein